jgi:hypothetical protein
VFQFRCVDLRDGFADFFLVEGPLLRSWTCLSDRVGLAGGATDEES